MHIHHPEIAEHFDEETRKAGKKKLPYKVGKRAVDGLKSAHKRKKD